MKKFLLILFLSLTIHAQTIKDISNIVGIRENQLIGYGLVVGAKTGGDSQLSAQTLNNLLRNANIKLNAGDAGDSGAVVVTATLPAFARQGDKLKVEVASLDGANLDGAKLLVTQLKGIDGKVYALAQGTILGVTGETPRVRGRRGDESKTGYIYDGAIVENEIPYDLNAETSLTLSLIKQNAKIAALIEKKINEKFMLRLATAYDTRTIRVQKPMDMSMVGFIAEIQDIKIDIMMKKKVIIDSVKEIIIAGADITISPVTISRENFTIRIKKSDLGEKAWNDEAVNKGKDIGDDTKVEQLPDQVMDQPVVIDINNALINTQKQPTVSDLMRAMKMMKVDITEIIETIKMLDSLDAINAEVEMVR